MISVSQAPLQQEPPARIRLPEVAEWRAAVDPFEAPSTPRALRQLVDTLVPVALLWLAMSWVAPQSIWLALPLAALTGLVLVRAFILFHDCCHGSFFASPRWNTWTGVVISLLVWTPFHHWRWEHARHHASSGNLDQRGLGDVWTMTVEEYRRAPLRRRLAYRFARNPFVLFLLAPLYLFAYQQRMASPKANRRVRRSVRWTNLALVAKAVLFSLWLGPWTYLALELTAIHFAAAAGIWLFYVQHQYQDVYWQRGNDWNYTAAALEGSSFYNLPPILRWFSGNIGYHHLHHLSPRIPNYKLVRCHRSSPHFEQVRPLTLWRSLRSMHLHLWDEERGRLVGLG
ncbi:MAG: fatty acid desaturase, partial [Planctomycetota bacterium]